MKLMKEILKAHDKKQFKSDKSGIDNVRFVLECLSDMDMGKLLVKYGKREMTTQLAYNGWHKTSKGMREMNYQYTQQFERVIMLKLPIQPLLVLCGVSACLLFLNY
jgi:hypothetical protein